MSINVPFPEALLDALPDNVLITEAGGRIVQANARARRTLTLGPGPGTTLLTDLFPFRDPDLGPTVSGEEQPSFEDIARGLDGREFRVLVRMGPGAAGHQVWLITDLTREQDDRQGMIDFMADLTAAQARIREYARQIEVFREVVDGMDQGIILSDPDQRVGFSNSFANQLFGRELTGITIEALRSMLCSATEEALAPLVKGEVLVLNETKGLQTRCFLNVAPLFSDERDPVGSGPQAPLAQGLVWTFFELTEEIANTQAFIDYSAELATLNRDLQRKNQEILHLSRTDVLTGLANRRCILEVLQKAVDSTSPSALPLSVALFDVDRFKEINDRAGHLVGDEVLRQIATFASEALGSQGTLGRYGGEEFLMVLPGSNLDQAHAVAERVRRAVQQGTEAKGRAVTVTIGVASYDSDLPVDALLSSADHAMYRGKAAGRNLVVSSPNS